MKPKKILLIGWDAADWSVARPLMEQGKMPALKRLVSEGVSGNLATIRPVLSPMLWTSIATGKRAWKHGIHGFSEPMPNGAGIRPITNLSRKCKAVWNIFNQQGWKSNVIGWWPSAPAEPINGVMVSNHFQQAIADLGKPWQMRSGTVHPRELEEPLMDLRIHPAELENEHILPFVPSAATVDPAKDTRLESCAKIIAEISSVHAAATACMQLEPWDFMAVYYDGIDHFGHGFMRYHPPRQPWVDEEDFKRYSGVVEAAYRYHDMMLDTLLKLAGDDTTVMLISDHGFESGDLRPRHLPNEPAGPAAEHSPFGMFCLRGPGIKHGEEIHGASLLDITPTLLHLNGLEVGADMDGKVLVNCFEEVQAVRFTESWEQIEGADGRHPENIQLDVADSRESIKQLVELGYIDEPNPDKAKAVDETLRELRYNLAQAYMDGGLFADAASVLEKLWARWPDYSRFGTKLLTCCLAQKDAERSRETMTLLEERKAAAVESAQRELEQFQADIESRDAGARSLSRAEQQKLRRLKGQAGVNPSALAFFEGSVRLLEGCPEDAAELLQKAAAAQNASKPSVYAKLGEAYAAQKDWSRAESHYLQALSLAPNAADARIGLAKVQIEKKDYFHAAAEALAAIGLVYHNPQAHTLYGTALMGLGKFKLAEQTLLTAARQNLNYPAAHLQLSVLYGSGPLHDAAKQQEYQQLAEQARERIQTARFEPQFEDSQQLVEFPRIAPVGGRLSSGDAASLVVVSGLPRSGTSLMMQMLEAGGIQALSDGIRQADASNPKGYYEHERVKRLAVETEWSWLHDAQRQALKVVAPLVTFLPELIPVKVIFMERPVSEVIDSQRVMLERDAKHGASSSDGSLAAVYARHLELCNRWAAEREQVEVLPLGYADVIAEPALAAKRIAEFLPGFGLDVATMAAMVDPALYRQRFAPVVASVE